MLTTQVIEGCQLYARANRSDPFALARALSHSVNGVTTYCQRSTLIHGSNDRGMIQTMHEGPSGYTAQSFPVTKRDAEGTEYFVTEFRNVQRP